MINISNFLQEIYQNPNLFLVVLTTVYVILTFRILRANQKILKANLMPILSPRVLVKKNSLQFELKNYSSYPAYDIDIWLIGVYYEENVPYKSLLQKKYEKEIKIDFRNSLFEFDDEVRFYGVVDRVIYCTFPPKNKCSFIPQFAKIPESMNLILQYRDAIGKNYLYQTWLFREFNGKSNVFKSGYLRHLPLKHVNRIDYEYFTEDIREIYKNGKLTNFFHFLRLLQEFILNKIKIRIYIDRDIRDILRRVIFSGQQKKIKNNFKGVEDRGRFQQIN